VLEANRIVTVTMHPAVDQVIEVGGLQLGQTCKGRLLARSPAGKGINVSRVAGILGLDSIATGFIGAGELDWFEAHLAEYGCSRAQLLSVHGETRCNITLVDGVTGEHTHVRTTGFPTRQDDYDRLRRKLSLLARRGTTVVFAGSLPPGIEPAALAKLVDLVARRGANTVVDTADEALLALADCRVDLLKVNREELGQLTGSPGAELAEVAAAAEGVLSRGLASAAVVTLAEQGALVVREGERRRAWVNLRASETVANTVGCGDALLAGLLVGGRDPELADERERWEAAMRLALATATASALTSRAAVVAPADVKALAERVVFESI
jgi:1-phosphofructokinase family hexose kinase